MKALVLSGTVISWLAVGYLYLFHDHQALPLLETLPYAGPNSIYVPGGGFAGFWYHLGLLAEHKDALLLHEQDYDFYCYSSGCLVLLLAALNRTNVDATYHECHAIQTAWRSGNLSQYELVQDFLNRFLPDNIVDSRQQESLEAFLPRLFVLVTAAKSGGAEARTATTLEELKTLLLQTTWIPFVTGPAWAPQEEQTYYLDGGFSRLWHPPCEHSLDIPVRWQTVLHTLNPALSRPLVDEFYDMGRRADSAVEKILFAGQRPDSEEYEAATHNESDISVWSQQQQPPDDLRSNAIPAHTAAWLVDSR